MSRPYEVYWIHLPEHVDIWTQGYVGITCRGVRRRFSEHKYSRKSIVGRAIHKYGVENLVVDTVCVADEDYALYLENFLRPTENIAWNIRAGGTKSAQLAGEKHPNWKGGSYTYRLRKGIATKEEIALVRLEGRKKQSERFLGIPLEDYHKRKLSGAKNKFFDENGFWCNSQAKPDLWKDADKIYSFFTLLAATRATISSYFGIPEWQAKKMVSKFHAGWNPNKDDRWIKYFKQEQLC